jgi:hypothetical protein
MFDCGVISTDGMPAILPAMVDGRRPTAHTAMGRYLPGLRQL